MLNYLIAPQVANRPRTTVWTRIETALAATFAALYRRYRRWVTIRELQGLDDRTLKDIGLDRSEIDSVAYTKGIGRHAHYINFDVYRFGR